MQDAQERQRLLTVQQAITIVTITCWPSAVRIPHSQKPGLRARRRYVQVWIGVLQLLAVPVDLCNGADVFCLQ